LRSRSLIDVLTGSRFMLWSQRHREDVCRLRLCPSVRRYATAPPPPSAPPPLENFITYLTWLPSCVAFTALYLLARLKSSGRRLFTSVLMNTSKIVCYDTCSNKPWHVVGQGMFSLKKI
ncbi:hypothetical protein BKA62DRAFT_695802, partial [Auriculariales sp. MPI-PUGE-AT-0066]